MKPIVLTASIAVWSLSSGWNCAQAATRTFPNWAPEGRMLQRLGPPVQVAGYTLRPPQGYRVQRFSGPLGVTGLAWVSSPRADGVRGYVMAGTVTAARSQMSGFTLEKAVNTFMQSVAQRRTRSQRTPTERGVVNGLTLARAYWHGIDRATGYRMSGFVYIAREGATVLYFSSQDVAPYAGALPLAEAAVLTIRKGSGVAPASAVQQGRLAPAVAVQQGRPALIAAAPQGRAMQAMIPDEFELKGTGVQIIYSTTSFVGTPQLTYTSGGKRKTFTGTEILSEPCALGQLVTVTLDAIPDYKSNTLTLVIPQINLQRSDGHFATFAVLTTERSSRSGPSGISGPIQSYQVIQLQGVSKSVAF